MAPAIDAGREERDIAGRLSAKWKHPFFVTRRKRMESPEHIQNEIAAMVAYQMGIQFAAVKPESRLVEDFGMTGDDADEFMSEYFRMFGIEAGDFRFGDHFGPEAACNPFVLMSSNSSTCKTITIRHLMNVANNKQWFMPPKSI